MKLMVFLVLLVVTASASGVLAVTDKKIHPAVVSTGSFCSLGSCKDASPLFYITEAVPIPNASKEFETLVSLGDGGFKFAGLRPMSIDETRNFLRWFNKYKISQRKFEPGKYICTQFVLDLISNAAKAGFDNIYFVRVSPWFTKGYQNGDHNIAAMNVTSLGCVFLDAQYGAIINRPILCRSNTIDENLYICDPALIKAPKWNNDSTAMIVDVPYINVYLKAVKGRASFVGLNVTST